MATVQEVEQQLIDWYNAEYADSKWHVTPARSFGHALDNGLAESLEYAEVHIPAGVTKPEATFGGEGQGDKVWVVFSLNGTQYFRIDGSYTSWDGSDWNYSSLYEVEPHPVTVIQYRRKAK